MSEAPRLVDAMPRPLGVVFALAALVALGGIVIGLTHPPQRIALEDRRPPGRSGYSHYAGAVAPLPVPAGAPATPECPAFAGTKLVAGADGVARMAEALARLCDLTTGGVSADVQAGLRGIAGATIRFATFASTGVDATAEFATRTIWINSRFALHRVAPATLAPLMVEEGLYIEEARLDAPPVPSQRTEASSPSAAAGPEHPASAARELRARNAEVNVCRALIDTRKWPRGCKDAETLTSMPAGEALGLLRSAGFA